MLSLPFDMAEFALALQGVLSATERAASRSAPFLSWCADARNTLSAHSLGALGARNLQMAGVLPVSGAAARLLGAPLVLGGSGAHAARTQIVCFAGDPIGLPTALLQHAITPERTAIVARVGHSYRSYLRHT